MVKTRMTRANRWWSPDFSLGAHSRQDFRSSVGGLPHTHSEYSVVVCLAGEMRFIIDGVEQWLEAGEMLMHNPGQVHQSFYGTGESLCESASIMFSREAMMTFLPRIGIRYPQGDQQIWFLGKVADSRVVQLAQELVRECRGHEIGQEVMIQSLVIQVLVHLFRQCLAPTVMPVKSLQKQLPGWEMSRAMEYMEGLGKSEFSTSELCRAVGTSQSRFVPLFKNSTGLNPRLYYDCTLVHQAQQYLLSEDCSIKEVAYELGFRDVSHFCKMFRSISGISPMTFRESPSQAQLAVTRKSPSRLLTQVHRPPSTESQLPRPSGG